MPLLREGEASGARTPRAASPAIATTSPRAGGRAAAGAVPRRAPCARWVQPLLPGGASPAPCARRRWTRAGAAAGARPPAGPGPVACRRSAPGGNGRGGRLLRAVPLGPGGEKSAELRGCFLPCAPRWPPLPPPPGKVVSRRQGAVRAALRRLLRRRGHRPARERGRTGRLPGAGGRWRQRCGGSVPQRTGAALASRCGDGDGGGACSGWFGRVS